jgi:hypothetical protein
MHHARAGEHGSVAGPGEARRHHDRERADSAQNSFTHELTHDA